MRSRFTDGFFKAFKWFTCQENPRRWDDKLEYVTLLIMLYAGILAFGSLLWFLLS